MRELLLVLLTAAIACTWSNGALAQTKIAWTDSCGKAEPDYTVPVGDLAGHTLGVSQVKCQATQPAEISGDKGKEAVATLTSDTSGDKSRERGVYVLTMTSGDKAFLPFQGNVTLKDNKPTVSQGTWILVGGSGKLKGIKGKGTFHCEATGDGFNCAGEGEYELAK
jgi:hypothetical protein